MKEYVNVRASETLDQDELVAFLKSRFPKITRPVGHRSPKGTECVEVRVASNSPELEEIRSFIDARRTQGLRAYCKFNIGWYLRKYTEEELQQAEALWVKDLPHFEPCGEECGTVYETLCNECNWGRQASDLILDLRRAPQNRDIAETIAWVEKVVSSNFVRTFHENKLRGAEFRPIIEFKNPTKRSTQWHQLWVTGKAGALAKQMRLGRDAFNAAQVSWRCALGHSVAAEFLSEPYLHRDEWDGSDISATSTLFGQGGYHLRPVPLIIISQRMYRAIKQTGLKGFTYEIAHLV